MAKTGRKPKPRAVRELEGNRGHRPLPQATPALSTGTTPPAFLDTAAKNEWRRIYPELAAANIVTRVDRAAVAAYCVAWSRWSQAEEAIAAFVAKHGTNTYRTTSGVWKPIPQLAISRAACEDMRRWAAELGITPAARSRVSPTEKVPDKHDPLAAFMAGGGPIPVDRSAN